jgi:hypothetical protein
VGRPAARGAPPFSSGAHLKRPKSQGLLNNLEQAGYTDIKIMPESFLVRAKDRSGNPIMMVINPDSITAVTEIIPKEPESATTGSAAGSGGGPVNSGAGVRGLPGSKSGPTVTPSGTTLAEPQVTKPDQSGATFPFCNLHYRQRLMNKP